MHKNKKYSYSTSSYYKITMHKQVYGVMEKLQKKN